MPHVMVIADQDLPRERTRELHDLCQTFAAFLGEPVEFACVRPELAGLARLSIAPMTGDDPIEVLQPVRAVTEGMATAGVVYTEDGRPDFTLKDQVKSVITVVAKVAHYWQMHALVYGLDDGAEAEASG